MKTRTVTTYGVKELNEKARARAIEKRRDWNLDGDWLNFTYDDAKALGALMGIAVRDIGFSGFSSQGDGAHFVGTYTPISGGGVDAVREYTSGTDAQLLRIATDLAECTASATVTHSGRYPHENCTEIDVDTGSKDIRVATRNALRAFMRWIYAQLEKDYEYRTSDEAIVDALDANDVGFLANGTVFNAPEAL